MCCPAGVTVPLRPSGRASFGANCATCPLRDKCTTAAKGRVIVLNQHHDRLVAARRQADTDAFDDTYRRWRPMVERSLAWLTRDDLAISRTAPPRSATRLFCPDRRARASPVLSP